MNGTVAAACCVLVGCLGAVPGFAIEWPGRAAGLDAAWSEADSAGRVDLLAEIDSVDDPRIPDLLRVASLSPSEGVRGEAARAIGRANAWELEDVLVDLLTDRAASVRVLAATSLGELALPGAVEPLVRARSDTNADVRVAVVEALGRLGDPDATLAIVDSLNDTNRTVVVAALGALGRLGHRGAVFAVLEKLNDPMREVAIAACSVVADLRAIEAVPALVELVGSGEPEVAIAAINALGAIRGRAATPALVGQVLTPRVEGARGPALEALVATADPAALVLLDAVDELGEGALDALVEAIGPRAARELAARYERVDRDSERALLLLGLWLRTGDPAAVDALDMAWSSGALDDSIGERFEWLGRSPSAPAWCRRAQLHTTVPPSDEAWRIVLDGADVPGAADCLLGLIADVDTLSSDIAVLVVEALVAVGRPEAVAIADRYIDPERLDGETGLRLVVALRSLGDAGLPGLARLLSVEHARIRRDASNALADQSSPWIDEVELDDLVARHTVRADVLLALDGQRGDPRVAAMIGAATASPALVVRSAARSVAACDTIDRDRLAADRGPDVPMLFRRSAWLSAARCGFVDVDEIAADELDPVVRALAVGAGHEADRFADARSVDERLEVVAGTDDIEALTRWARGRDPVVAAAAILRLGPLEPSGSPMAWMRGASAESPLLRAAWFATASTDMDARAWAMRTETHPSVLAILAEADALTAPVIVSAVDVRTGGARPNELVLGITAGRELVHGRTDVFGRLRWDRDDVLAVFVVGESS